VKIRSDRGMIRRILDILLCPFALRLDLRKGHDICGVNSEAEGMRTIRRLHAALLEDVEEPDERNNQDRNQRPWCDAKHLRQRDLPEIAPCEDVVG